MKGRKMKKYLTLYIIAILGLMLAGCGGDVTGNTTTEYTVDGLLMLDPNTDQAFCYALILQEGTSIPNLTSYIVTSATDSAAMTPRGGGAYLTTDGALELGADSTYTIRAEEQFGDFYFSMTLDMADTFHVEVLSPASRIYSGGTVSITWNAPSQDFGYFVTIDPPSSEAVPFAEISNTSTNYTIPADAFTKSTGERVPGVYYIYVIAYKDTFYSDAFIENNDHVFYPYPDQGFSDNIDRIGVSGRFGTALVAYYDSVIVTANQ